MRVGFEIRFGFDGGESVWRAWYVPFLCYLSIM